MNDTARDMKLPALVILVAAMVMMLLGGGINSAKAAPITCTDYELKYNGQVGKVTFPKGNYALIGINKEKIVCDYALENFQAFLQNFNNRPTKPWVMSSKVEDEVRTTTFRRGKKSKVGFTISADIASTTFPPIEEAKACKGNFKFKKATKIGTFRIPKGSYRLSPVNEESLSCGKSLKQFKTFLKRGRITSKWKLTKSSATFVLKDKRQTGFYITRNVAAAAS